MKIKMTNLALNSVMEILVKFVNVTGKLGYAISVTNDDIKNKIKPFYAERDKLIKKYGTDDGDGNYSVKQDSDEYIAFARELTDVLDMTTEIDFYQISSDEFYASDYYVDNASARDYDIIKTLFIKSDIEETAKTAETAE